jgi:hypothetical protein
MKYASAVLSFSNWEHVAVHQGLYEVAGKPWLITLQHQFCSVVSHLKYYFYIKTNPDIVWRRVQNLHEFLGTDMRFQTPIKFESFFGTFFFGGGGMGV